MTLTSDIIAHAIVQACKAYDIDPVEAFTAEPMRSERLERPLVAAAAAVWDAGLTTQARAARCCRISPAVLASALHRGNPNFSRAWQRANRAVWRAMRPAEVA